MTGGNCRRCRRLRPNASLANQADAAVRCTGPDEVMYSPAALARGMLKADLTW
jgi:hypothetical protein